METLNHHYTIVDPPGLLPFALLTLSHDARGKRNIDFDIQHMWYRVENTDIIELSSAAYQAFAPGLDHQQRLIRNTNPNRAVLVDFTSSVRSVFIPFDENQVATAYHVNTNDAPKPFAFWANFHWALVWDLDDLLANSVQTSHQRTHQFWTLNQDRWVNWFWSNTLFSKKRLICLNEAYHGVRQSTWLFKVVDESGFSRYEQREIPLFIRTQVSLYPEVEHLSGFFETERLVAVLYRSAYSQQNISLVIYRTRKGDKQLVLTKQREVANFPNLDFYG